MSLHLILGCMYSGKCYEKSTLVLSENREYVRICNFKIGDKVLGVDSKPKTINNIHKSHVPVFLCSYGKKSYIVSENHKLVLYDSKTNQEVNKFAYEFYELYKNEPNRYFQIVSPIKTGILTEPFEPYAIGFFYSSKNVKDKDILLKLRKLKVNYLEFSKIVKNISEFPQEVKSYSYESRVSCLTGLYEGSGQGKQFSFNNKSVADDISWLFWSVGVPNTVLKNNKKYSVKLISEFKPTRENVYIPLTNYRPFGSKETIGLEVEGEHLILENCIIGHNSSELIHEISKYKGNNYNVFCINSIFDTRHKDNVIMTHDKITIPCCKVKTLQESKELIPSGTRVIGIDEAQFFPDLVEFVNQQLSLGRKLIVAGLDGDSNQKKFGSILDLIPQADSYVKKYALCTKCSKPAIFTKRITNDTNQILVGAKESYIATCRECNNIN